MFKNKISSILYMQMSQQKNQNFNNKIETFLKSFRVSTDDPYNLISMGDQYKGKFNLDNKTYKQFIKLYGEAAKNGLILSLAEKQNEYGPLIIDIDLLKDKSTDDNQRLYNNEMILLMINTFKSVIREYLFIENDEQLEVSLFEKPKASIKEHNFKDGFHLIFNSLKIHYKLRYLIRDKVVKLLSDNLIFKTFTESVEKIIDKSVIHTNSWLLPFSKKPEGQLYELTTIYDINNNPNDIKELKADNLLLINIFCLNTKFRNDAAPTKYKENITTEQIEEEFNKYCNNLTNKPTETTTEKKELYFKEGKTLYDFVERILKILNKERAESWEKWRNIGFIIHFVFYTHPIFITNGCEVTIENVLNEKVTNNGFELFNNFSKQSDKYNLHKVTKFWDSIKPASDKQLNIFSLIKIANLDNKEEYKIIADEFIRTKPITNKDLKKLFQDNADKQGVYNDLDAANVVYANYPNFVCCDSILYVFDDESGIWTDKEEVIFKIISRYTNLLYLLTTNSKGEVKVNKKGYGDSSNLKRQMIPELKTLCINNNWVKESEMTSIGKLLFKNGYYNMKTGIFTSGFNPDIVFHYKIYRNYTKSDINLNYIDDVRARFIYNQLGENVGNYLLLQLARGLAGDIMKKFLFGLGDANNGKSTIVKACQSAFGEYIGSFNAENLCFKTSGADEAAQMRWALLLRYKRIIFSNEIKMSTEINGNMIKKISSGGDVLIARVHGGLESEFIPHFLGVSYANDMPKISGIDTDQAINNRLKFFNYNKKYVKEPLNEFELLIDDNIDNEINSDKFRDAFQYILFDAYLNYIKNGRIDEEPDEVKNNKLEWVGDGGSNKTINKFLENFEITDNVNHFTLSKDIEMWLTNEKIGITMTKFSMELKKYCMLKKYQNVKSKDKKVGGKCKQAWFGIKSINDDDSDDDEPKSGLDA